jgi:hypothetical protein
VLERPGTMQAACKLLPRQLRGPLLSHTPWGCAGREARGQGWQEFSRCPDLGDGVSRRCILDIPEALRHRLTHPELRSTRLQTKDRFLDPHRRTLQVLPCLHSRTCRRTLRPERCRPGCISNVSKLPPLPLQPVVLTWSKILDARKGLCGVACSSDLCNKEGAQDRNCEACQASHCSQTICACGERG